uniref:B30.2/SPRY domain-containing protein n=1 Tax=Sinocyclocheilus anshuiensis TaxID=1608454 RepID=A0A671SH59_9TELE
MSIFQYLFTVSVKGVVHFQNKNVLMIYSPPGHPRCSFLSFTVVVPGDPIAAHVGSTVIVPCWISPPENAEALEIRWYRHDQFSNPVLLYNHGKIQDVQEEPYRNRTSLALRSDHFCVRRRSEHLSLLLSSALGSAPVLFPKPLDDGRVNISCRSSGWYPKPSVSWTSDDGRALRPGGSSHSRGADEMFSVHSWTAVSLSDAQLVSCSISLRTGELKEGRLNIQGIVSSVEITIDREHLHPDLKLSKDCKTVRDSKDYHHTGEGFPFQFCAFGAQRFTSGRHYWEVELAQTNTPPKNYWLIGVVKHGHFTTRDRSALTPSAGFWFLCSDGPHGFYTNTEPPVKLSLTPRPERLGVLLDYDEGLLSFYNVKESKHLLTISSRFSGSVGPLFNPGAGDLSPIMILDCPEPVESAVELAAESSDNPEPVELPQSSQPLLSNNSSDA